MYKDLGDIGIIDILLIHYFNNPSLEIIYITHQRAMKIAYLLNTVWLTRYFWKAEITYN